MVRIRWLWLLSGLTIVSGRISPIQPLENSIHTAGSSLLVSWADDSHRPSLEDTGVMKIDLYAGNSTFVDTLAAGVLPNALTLTVSLPIDLPFTVADYTLRFITTVPAMTVYSADFIIVSSSGPSITLVSHGAPIPPTVTVTRTTAIPAQTLRQAVGTTHIVTLTQLPVGLGQPARVSPASGPPIPDATAIEEVLPDDLDTAAVPQEPPATSVTRVYPIFISKLASSSHTSRSPVSTSSNSSNVLLATTAPGANLTSSSSTPPDGGSTILVPTNVIRPSSLKPSQTSGVRAQQVDAGFGLLTLVPVVMFVFL